MGILGLTTFLKKFNALEKVPLSFFQDKWVGIDAPIGIYRMKQTIFLSPRHHDKPEQVRTNIFVHQYVKSLDRFPLKIMFFDGTRRPEKCKREKTDYAPSRNDFEKIKQKFQRINVKCITELPDAEQTACIWNQQDKVYAVYSNDGDCIPFGARIWIKEIKGNECIIVRKETLLKNTGLTNEQLIDLCIMLGCDYNPRIPGYGPEKNAYNYIKEGDLLGHLSTKEFCIARSIFTNGIHKWSNIENSKLELQDSLPQEEQEEDTLPTEE